MKIVIIGIADHNYQYPRPGNSHAKDFGSYLAKLCKEHTFSIIAEELSEEELAFRGLSESIARQVAVSNHGIEHLFADPNKDERRALGIPDDDEICRLHHIRRADFEDLGDAEIKTKGRLYWPRREAEWLRRIRERDTFPCLMIVGAAHVRSFSELLKTEAIDVSVVCDRWQPKERNVQ
jgi:hypothetical protein